MHQIILMRFLILLFVFCCGVAQANPSIPADVTNLFYMSSENLAVTISKQEARFAGEFAFQARSKWRIPQWARLKIPVWVPDSVLKADFDDVLKSVDLHVHMKTGKTNPPSDLIGARMDPNFVPEPGFRSLLLYYDCKASKEIDYALHYRQPLTESGGESRFFYIPMFDSVPERKFTEDPNRYLITLIAAPGCFLAGTNGNQFFSLLPGEKIVLNPKHNQPIRAIIRSMQNKGSRGPKASD